MIKLGGGSSRTQGFLPFGSPEALWYHPLTSNPVNSPHANMGTVSLVGTGHSFDSAKGVSFPTSLGGIRIQDFVDNVFFRNGGTISFEIEKGWIHNGNIFVNEQYSVWAEMAGGDWNMLWRDNGTTPTRSFHDVIGLNATIGQETKPDFARIDISHDGTTIQVYQDYGLTQQYLVDKVNGSSFLFDDLYIGGNGINKSGPDTFYIRNIQCSLKPLNSPIHPDLTAIMQYGDSWSERGDYPPAGSLFWVGDGKAPDHRDYGSTMAIHRELGRSGLFSNKITNYADGGAGVILIGPTSPTGGTLEEQLDSSLVTNGDVPTIAVVFMGIGDLLLDLNGGAWQSTYQTQVQRLITAGCNKIILVSMPQQFDQWSNISTAEVDAQNISINAVAAALISDTVDVQVVTIADSIPNSMWNDIGTDAHVNGEGSNIWGTMVGATIKGMLT